MAKLPHIEEQFLFTTLAANSPWIVGRHHFISTAPFRREAYKKVRQQLDANHGMATLIKGPRRVGKTEIQKQMIVDLMNEGVNPKNILYLSMDDVQIQTEDPKNRWRMVNDLLNAWAKQLGYETFDLIRERAYCFLDEVQAVEHWATLLKNRIERNPNVRIVLSGSAAHSIFKKSLEVLLGRVITVALAPFSFREYIQCHSGRELPQINHLYTIQNVFERDFSPSQLFTDLKGYTSEFVAEDTRQHLRGYLKDGGFPQLWKIAEEDVIEKAHIIDENYVKKVTLEDLMLLRKIRKPELFERLLRHLFARPGQEYNQQKVAANLGTTMVTLSDAMDLLRQTDLLLFVEKFSSKAEPLKRKNVKIYPTDLALTFAMTKIVPSLEDDIAKGALAESLVAQVLSRLRSVSNLAFMKKETSLEKGEIDFYVRSDTKDCPIEVKYQSSIRSEDTKLLEKVILEKELGGGIVITPNEWSQTRSISSIPLWAFALIS